MRQRRPEADLDPGPDRLIGGSYLDDRGRAIQFGTKLNTLIAGNDGERAAGRQHGTGDDPQAVAQRAALRQP
jgi:hypothetical protein